MWIAASSSPSERRRVRGCAERTGEEGGLRGRGRGELPGRRIVATTMSNMGLEKALEAAKVDVVRCGVGDREVVEVMRREGVRLGGEQSGHLVDLELGATGDGLLTAAAVAAIVAASGRTLADLAAGFGRFPQTLRNVKVREKQPLESVPGLSEAVASVERELGTSGRVLLRYSGTEPLARVMIEGPDQKRIEELCSRIATVLEAELGLHGTTVPRAPARPEGCGRC